MTKRMAILAAAPIDPNGYTDMQAIWGDDVELSFASVITEKTAEAMQPYASDKGDRVLMSGLDDNTVTTVSINKVTAPVEELLGRYKGQGGFCLFLVCRRLPASFPPRYSQFSRTCFCAVLCRACFSRP